MSIDPFFARDEIHGGAATVTPGRFTRPGLRGMLLLMSAAVVLGVLSLFVVEDIRQRTDRWQQELIYDVETIGRFIAITAPEAILGYDHITLNHYIRELTNHHDVVYALISRNDRPLTTYVNPSIGSYTVEMEGGETDLSQVLPVLRKLERLRILEIPIIAAGNPLGQLEIGVSLVRMDEVKREILEQQILRGGALLVLLSLGTFITFGIYILRPVNRILGTLELGWHGRQEHLIPVVRNDELGRVAIAINRMINDVRQSHADLTVQRNQIRLLLDSTAEGIIGSDTMGVITFANQSALEMLGYSTSSLVGQDLHLHFNHAHHRGTLARDCPLFRSVLDGELHHNPDGHLVNSLREPLEVEYWMRPIIDEIGTSGVILTFVDISARKRAELRLQQTLASLDEQVRQRTIELNQRLEELERTRNELIQTEKMASLGRLVAGFSHEINTPIGVALGGASHIDDGGRELLRLLTEDEVDEEVLSDLLNNMIEASQLTVSNLRRASTLIASFKRTAIDQSSEESRLFDICISVDDVVTSLHNRFKRTEVVIETECESNIQLHGRPGLIDQLITNLLINGLVHAYNDGQVAGTIRLRVYRSGDMIAIDYRDDGCGMDGETRARIFEPFYTTARGRGGSGLGLFICYNIVTNELNGTLQVESEPGVGTRFLVLLPATSLTPPPGDEEGNGAE
jgi:PAS domain S-box-containing protein